MKSETESIILSENDNDVKTGTLLSTNSEAFKSKVGRMDYQ